MSEVALPEWSVHLLWDLDEPMRVRTIQPSEALWEWLTEFSAYTDNIVEENYGMTFVFNDADVAQLFELTWT